MSTTMKAARFHHHHDIRIDDLPRPILSPSSSGTVLVEIEWCGICGTDITEYTHGPTIIPTPSHPHPTSTESLPLTLGHEFVGRVLDSGKRVVVDPRISCGKCASCDAGQETFCPGWGFVGLSGGGGGFAEFVQVPAGKCYGIPEAVDPAAAVLIEPLCVGRHALAVAGRGEWKTVLVLGAGPIGLSVLWNLRASGRNVVVVVSEPGVERRGMVGGLAEVVVGPGEVVGECWEVTGGRGVDVVFDCAGKLGGLEGGMEALRARGVYVNVAGWEGPLTVPMRFAMMKEITIKFSFAYDDEDFRGVVDDFVAGKFKGVEKMITSRILLRDLVSKGFEELVNNRDRHVKIIATPKEELLLKTTQNGS